MTTVASSAITQARARLGAVPMEWLYERTAAEWAIASANRDRWRDLALYGVDGTTLRVPDSDENRKHFGSQSAGKRGATGYPQVRLVALMALRSHLLAAACFPYATDERQCAKALWDTVPEQSLVLVDRNFLQASALVGLA